MTTATTAPLDDLERPLAFVLGGGASLGATQVGMLRALLERGLEPDLLVGTSVGAINAAFLARDYSADRLDRLEEIWTSIDRGDIFPGAGLWRAARMVTGGRSSLASNQGLRTLVDDHLPGAHGDLAVPTAVLGTDVLGGEKVVFQSGDLREHVLISASIPIIFEPIEHDERTLVDGGVSCNVPILPAHQLGARSMIVLDPGHACSLDSAPSDLLGRALHLMTLMLRHQAQSILPFLEAESQILYVPPPCPMDVPPHDFSHTRRLIDSGHDRASTFLADVELDGPGIYGHPHDHTRPTSH